MIPFTLEEIAAHLGGTVQGASDESVEAVSTDSRTLEAGELFVALPGPERDGHDFVAAADQAGAAAALVSRPVPASLPQVVVDDTWAGLRRLAAVVRGAVDPVTVAITGSVGKTTTKDLAAAALGSRLETVAALGSHNNELGVPLTLLRLREDSQALVCELGARGSGDIAALARLVQPDVGVVTRVAGVHLELFGDIDTVAKAKGELVEALPDSGWAILNADDDRVSSMAALTEAAVVRYGVDDRVDAEVRARELRLDDRARARFVARTPWGSVPVRLPLAGAHNVGNALAALAVAGVTGIDLETAAAAIAAAPVSDWRGEVVDAGGVTVLNDAYNANPTAVLAAVETLEAIDCAGRRWAVLGVMAEIGPDHDGEHRRVGAAVAASRVDRLVVVGERAAPMAAGARRAGMAEDAVASVSDAEAALARVRDEIAVGDAVLVKASRVAGLEAVAAGLVAARGRVAS